MYKVYADDVLIHHSVSPSKEIHLIDPNLTMADSAAGSFTFTIGPNNEGYDSIKRFTTTIIVWEDDKIIWTGRVTNQTEDFWKRRKFTCEGALAYLNDSQQPLNYYKNMNSDSFFTALITLHNRRVPSNRRFQVGTITQHNRYDQYSYKTEYKSTFETIKSEFKDNLGGHIRVRYSGSNPTPIIDYLEDYPNTSSQVINFGENLLDFTRNWDVTNLCTVIIPRGKQLEDENEEGDKDYVTVKSVNNGSIYLKNDTTVAKYGEVERVVDFDTDNPSFLKTLGTNYLSSTQFDEMVLEVSAVDLHNINSSIVSFKLLDEVRCVSAPHGLDKMFPITQIDIPLDKPDGVKYTMGTNVTQSMSAQNVSAGQSFNGKLNIGLIDTLADAKRNAARIINAATTGYVNIITENETSQALVITNTPDIENATKLWRFNLNGLGYSKDGGETYDIAITMDGTIIADFIRTGTIDDGTGFNRWNLTTGEFQFAYNAKVANALGRTIEVVDIVQLAQDGVDDAANAKDTAELAQEDATTALRKQTGGTNILNGTNKNLKEATPIGSDSNWSNGTWDGKVGAAATKTIIDISNAPNPALVKGFSISLAATGSNNRQSFVTQRKVKVSSGQVYVLSCYARSAGSSLPKMSLGYFYTGGQISSTSSNVTSTWKRYSLGFKVDASKSEINVVFGIEGNNHNQTVYICGMQLERGNTPSDWSESEKDTYTISTTDSNKYTDSTATEVKTYSKKYTDTISKNDREFTKSQREALDASYNHQKVLQRLTDNYRIKTMYLLGNELYINATYIRSGTLDAGIVKAGILTDKKQNNKWNMTTGYLYTKNMEAENIRAKGRFECGDYYKVVNDGGEITGYRNKTTYVGSISPNATIRNISTKRDMYGFVVRAAGHMDIRTPTLGIRNKNDTGISDICYTGKIPIVMKINIQDAGNGKIRWNYVTANLNVVNGLIVSYHRDTSDPSDMSME